jgi:UDP-N-acetylglucosamine 2-epimerase
VRIVSVVGTRPQLIKAAALFPTLRARHEEVFVDTGQHWDDAMAGDFFVELGLPKPDHALRIGGGTAAEQIGRMLPAIAAVLADERPDAVLVYGDTNSTLAGALAAAATGVPVAHVEAGLRSFDRRMPEETNRVLTDHVARWLFAPTPTAVANLAAEGIRDGVVLVGDVMQDLAARVSAEVRDAGAVLPPIARRLGVDLSPGGFLFATIHRAENRSRDAIHAWAAILEGAARHDRPVVLALHPGTRKALESFGMSLGKDVCVVAPVDYRSTLALQLHAAAVITDSGGVQREAAWLGVPCLVLRGTTEWTEAVEGSGGSMVVVGLDTGRAAAELERLASPGASAELARQRAARLNLAPAGAADAIVATLEGARS